MLQKLSRIIIGGKVISEGMDLQMDLQKNTIAGHFLSLVWEGATLHQGRGRFRRQGNQNGTVHAYYYVLKETTDVYRWAMIANPHTRPPSFPLA